MNRFASNGPVAVTLVQRADEAVYEAVLNNKLIAQVKLEDWENPDIDFYSREAAQMLADSIREVYAADVEADMDEEASMIKHPDGETTDVPDAKELGLEKDNEINDDEPHGTRMIIIHLNELIVKAEKAHKDGNLELEAAFLDEADNFAARIATIKSEMVRESALSALAEAEDLLEQGLDCTAELEQTERLIATAVEMQNFKPMKSQDFQDMVNRETPGEHLTSDMPGKPVGNRGDTIPHLNPITPRPSFDTLNDGDANSRATWESVPNPNADYMKQKIQMSDAPGETPWMTQDRVQPMHNPNMVTDPKFNPLISRNSFFSKLSKVLFGNA